MWIFYFQSFTSWLSRKPPSRNFPLHISISMGTVRRWDGAHFCRRLHLFRIDQHKSSNVWQLSGHDDRRSILSLQLCFGKLNMHFCTRHRHRHCKWKMRDFSGRKMRCDDLETLNWILKEGWKNRGRFVHNRKTLYCPLRFSPSCPLSISYSSSYLLFVFHRQQH